jgi:hypothetical protein
MKFRCHFLEISMNERRDPIKSAEAAPHPDLEDVPGYVDGMPVEQLVKLAREFTQRITNEDLQRLAADLNESGHQRTIQSSAPYLLRGFFTGKIDLDVELNRRYPTPPLLSNMTFAPKPGQVRRHGFAQFASQDNSSVMTVEIHGSSGALEIGFLLYSMIGVRFMLGAITEQHRMRFLDLLERPSGIAFLWTRERWERDYIIFVVRDRFARLYAFGPGRNEAACRLTPDALAQLKAWLTGFWTANIAASEPSGSRSSASESIAPDPSATDGKPPAW